MYFGECSKSTVSRIPTNNGIITNYTPDSEAVFRRSDLKRLEPILVCVAGIENIIESV